MKDSLDAVLGRIGELWGTWKGLLVGLLPSLLILELVPEAAWNPTWMYWVALGSLSAIVLGAWWAFRTGGWSKRKLRLVLAIYCDKEDQRAELEEDFSKTLRQILKEGDLGKDVAIITASKAECQSIECDDDFSDLSDRKKAHLLLYGRIRTRKRGQEDVHVVELRAIVRHARLQDHAQKAFAQEISSVFPSETIHIPKSDQLPHFRATAEWVGFSSRYLISLAAITTGDFDYAERILKDAELLLPRLPANIKQHSALVERIRQRQHEVAVMQARRSYIAWRKSHDPIEVERIRERLEFAGARGKLRPENSQLLALVIFIANLSADQAEPLVRAAMFDHAVAHLNLAFLLAWQGRFDRARKSYRSAAKRKPDEEAFSQVITFFEWLSAHSPDHAYVCNWCEAIIRSEIDKSCVVARRIFSTLVRMTDRFPSAEIERMKSGLIEKGPEKIPV